MLSRFQTNFEDLFQQKLPQLTQAYNEILISTDMVLVSFV